MGESLDVVESLVNKVTRAYPVRMDAMEAGV